MNNLMTADQLEALLDTLRHIGGNYEDKTITVQRGKLGDYTVKVKAPEGERVVFEYIRPQYSDPYYRNYHPGRWEDYLHHLANTAKQAAAVKDELAPAPSQEPDYDFNSTLAANRAAHQAAIDAKMVLVLNLIVQDDATTSETGMTLSAYVAEGYRIIGVSDARRDDADSWWVITYTLQHEDTLPQPPECQC